MTVIEVLKLLTLVTSLGMSHWIRCMLVRLRVPVYLAVVLGVAVSLYTHHWFWIDLVAINRPDRNAWLWIAGHPFYLLGGLWIEFDERRKRARGTGAEG